MIAVDWLDLTVAAMLGEVIHSLTGILTQTEFEAAMRIGGGIIALLFGWQGRAQTRPESGLKTYIVSGGGIELRRVSRQVQ